MWWNWPFFLAIFIHQYEAPTYFLFFFLWLRFRMACPLFLRITHAVEAHDNYFVKKWDMWKTWVIMSAENLCTIYDDKLWSTSRSYGLVFSYWWSIVIKSLIRRLVAAIIESFGDEYLRSPNEQDMARLLASAERRGFLGMLGCQDFMHWQWRNCPTAWKGQYTGQVHESTIILEAIASKDL